MGYTTECFSVLWMKIETGRLIANEFIGESGAMR